MNRKVFFATLGSFLFGIKMPKSTAKEINLKDTNLIRIELNVPDALNYGCGHVINDFLCIKDGFLYLLNQYYRNKPLKVEMLNFRIYYEDKWHNLPFFIHHFLTVNTNHIGKKEILNSISHALAYETKVRITFQCFSK
jgi:hypothetical protein